MIQLTPQMRILLAVEPVDFRNHSGRVIIPSTSRETPEKIEDSAGFILSDTE